MVACLPCEIHGHPFGFPVSKYSGRLRTQSRWILHSSHEKNASCIAVMNQKHKRMVRRKYNRLGRFACMFNAKSLLFRTRAGSFDSTLGKGQNRTKKITGNITDTVFLAHVIVPLSLTPMISIPPFFLPSLDFPAFFSPILRKIMDLIHVTKVLFYWFNTGNRNLY